MSTTISPSAGGQPGAPPPGPPVTGLPRPPAPPVTAATAADPLRAPWGDHPIEMRAVRRTFGPVVAIEGISLTVPPGTMLGIIGPSGSGKTTTIRVITGAIGPDQGAVRVLGEDPRRFRRATRERIGYMPQLFVLYPDLTTRENVEFIASTFGLLWRRRGKRVRQVLELVDLWDARDRRASDLSGGMQRRLELACALVHEPSLLILDEPTAGIDPVLRQQVWQELERLRETGVTIVVTTQYVTEAEYCDGVALISEGELIAYAPPDEVRRQALGGEVIEVVTRRPFDVTVLPRLEGIIEIRQTGPRELLVITDDAARAGPSIVDAVDSAGGDVEASREYRPSFDEVFTALVTRHTEQRAIAAGQRPMSGGGASTLVPRRPR